MLVRFLKCLKFFVESCLRRSRPVQIIQFDLSPVGKNDLVLCRECCTKLKGQSVGSYQFNRWVDCSVGDFISNFLSVIFAMLSYNTVSFSSNGAFFDSINLNWKFFEKKVTLLRKMYNNPARVGERRRCRSDLIDLRCVDARDLFRVICKVQFFLSFTFCVQYHNLYIYKQLFF